MYFLDVQQHVSYIGSAREALKTSAKDLRTQLIDFLDSASKLVHIL